MPANRVTLDHVAVATPDLDAASDTYERLGFRLTPRGEHKGPLEPGGPIERWGTGNHCAMFRDGYYEVIGITDPNRFHEHIRARLDLYAGLSLIALGCEDVAAAAQGMAGRSVPLAGELTEMQRDIPCDGEMKPAGFRFSFPDDDFFPEAHCFYIQQLTPELLWQPALLDQPNGVTGLAGVTICSADPADTATRLEAVLGFPPDARQGGARFTLDRGWIDVTDTAGLADRFPGVAPPAMPWVAAVTFLVGDAGSTRQYLEERGMELRGGGASFWLPPGQAEGAILEFVAG